MAVFSYLVIGNQRVVMTSEERIRQLESENAALKNRVAYLERQLYGQRTEKYLPVNPDALQLSLFHNAIDPDEQRRRRTRRPAKGSSTSRSMTARSAR